MKTKPFLHYAAGALCAIMMAGAAHAETDEVTLARQFGIGYLPLTTR